MELQLCHNTSTDVIYGEDVTKVQMYEENWKRKHEPYTLVNMHEIVSWYEMLMFKVRMEESEELNYVMPVNPPIRFSGTFLHMKPMEQLYIYMI